MTEKRSSLWLGLLPYIGIILFLVQLPFTLGSGKTGAELHGQLVLDAVTYMIGWASLGGGITHILFGPQISKSIGFAHSPYEFEVGCSNLAMGITALFAAQHQPEFWLAVIWISSIYRIGCGIGHVREIIQNKNYAINNTAILLIDFGVPIFLLAMYYTWAPSLAA